MNNVIKIVEYYSTKISDGQIFFNPNIPNKKLNNAIKSYANINNETVLCLIDDTVFGSAKVGLILTDRAIYMKDSIEKNKLFCPLKNIKNVLFKNLFLSKRLIFNQTMQIDFTQPSKKSISLFAKMIQNICGISEEKNNTTSWKNVGMGAGIGALFGGPIGAAIGAAIGAFIKSDECEQNSFEQFDNEDEDYLCFTVTFSSIVAKMAKADGVITKAEAKIIMAIFDEMFENNFRKLAAKCFNQAKDDQYSIYDYVEQYNEIASYELKILLYRSLWIVAMSDSKLHKNEIDILRTILHYLDLPIENFHECLAEFNQKDENYNKSSNKTDETFGLSIEECFAILGASPDDNIATIKTKYRKLATQHHPDKIQSKNLPESFIKFATSELQKINFAYEAVLKYKN